MFDYLKKANSLLVIFIIFVMFACAHAQTQPNAELLEEQERAKIATLEISAYVKQQVDQRSWCFQLSKQCHELNQYHIDNMANIMVKYGWTYDDYHIAALLLYDKLFISLKFKSLVNPDYEYRARWLIQAYFEEPKQEEPKYRVERTRIFTDSQL